MGMARSMLPLCVCYYRELTKAAKWIQFFSLEMTISQITFACSKSTIETLEKRVKFVQS